MSLNTSESTTEGKPASKVRDELGRMIGVQYKFHEDGSIDWRGMIPNHHLFVNKKNLQKKGLPLTDNVEEVSDENLLIKLSGIKYLARVRGYKSVKYKIFSSSQEHCAVKCSIAWIPNFESEEVIYEDIANATIYNTSDFGQKFLETIAANRAFIRAVRNFLNIFIVGYEEIDNSNDKKDKDVKDSSSDAQSEEDSGLPTPQKLLEKLARKQGFNDTKSLYEFVSTVSPEISFPSLKATKSFHGISAKEVRIIQGILANK